MPTRSPMAKRGVSVPGPMASTAPTISCPGTTCGRCTGRSPSATCRSVRHTPQVRTATRISPGPGSGTARSTNANGCSSTGPGPATTHALIASTRELAGLASGTRWASEGLTNGKPLVGQWAFGHDVGVVAMTALGDDQTEVERAPTHHIGRVGIAPGPLITRRTNELDPHRISG